MKRPWKNPRLLPHRSAWMLLIGISGFCLFIIALLWNNLLKQVRYDRQQTINAAVQRNANLAVALEQYAIRTIQNADAALQSISKEALQHPHLTPEALLQHAPIFSELFAAVGVVNAEGRALIISDKHRKKATHSVAHRLYFTTHATRPGGGLFIGEPAHSDILGYSVIPFSRRLQKEDGSFGGIVVVFIEPATFTRFYAQADLRPRDIMSLVAPNGITYARRTGPRESFGENIRKSPLYRHLAQKPVGNYTAPDAIHNIYTYFSYRKLRDYPIIATVGVAEEDVLATFRERKFREYVITITVAVLLVLFTAGVCLFLLLRRRSDKIIKESEARYRLFFENSIDAILILKPDCGTLYAANSAACTIFKRTEEDIFAAGREGLIDSTDPRFTEFLTERRRTGRARGELTFYRRDGSTFPGEVASALFTDASGREYALMIIRDVTRQKQLQKQILKEQKRFQRQLTEQVIRAQEREREVIGRELHDNVNQVLTTVKLYLDLALSDPSASSGLLTKSIGYVQESISEIRKLSRALSAPTLGTKSLVDSINALLEMIRASAGLRVVFKHNRYGSKLPMDINLAVYRILQEQLNNIIKHARASKVLISLSQDSHGLTVVVKDNGRGFDTTQQHSGIGLNNIISRVQVFDGQVTIDSEPGKGCMLRFTIPHCRPPVSDPAKAAAQRPDTILK